MSFILDALRKSEIERQRQSGPSMAEFPVAREDRRLPVALVVIGFLLAVNLGVVLFFLLFDDAAAPSPAAEPAATSAAAQPAVAPAAQPSPVAPSPLESEALSADDYETEPPAVYYEPPVTQAPGAPWKKSASASRSSVARKSSAPIPAWRCFLRRRSSRWPPIPRRASAR